MNDALPPLRDVIARHGLGADKSFGQHFLLDLNITRKIARAAGADAHDTIIEVGPGPGGLTRALLETGALVIAVERDRRFITALQELQTAFPGRLTIVEADALRIDETALSGGAPVKIVSNLPYNISTELLVKWLVANHCNASPLWPQMTLMFQKEVADRILAAPGSKTYGRLSVIAQAASRPKRAFDLPARAFTPPPKVDSSVVTFEPAPERLPDIEALERLTQAAFSQRRKMLRSSLRPLFGDATEARLAAAMIEPTKRAEELSVADFLRLLE
ncbi:MAG: 16S rRNA (adenine(1518)-N(6)/adenine(1519)-N(6))-dimethyltransferase RsmA [Parvularculaceae bacterium]|nr:16S rRNA (adenine(1518)-N(6)/adenine(1519)-N(6))-dimethyltransferase RsmA [Parvularculaceae bacterium]